MELLRQRTRTASEASAEDSGEKWTTNILRLIGIKAPTHDPRSWKQPSSTFSAVRLLPLHSRFDGPSSRTDAGQARSFTTCSSQELSEADQTRVSTSTAPSTVVLSGLTSQCSVSTFASPTTTVSSSANTITSTTLALGAYQVEKGVFVSPTSKMSEHDLGVWKDIRKRLDDTLKNLFRPEPGLDPSVSLEFMVAGPSKSNLRPSIIIVCCNEPNRKRLKKMLKTQKWIAAYGYFCLVLVNPIEELSGPENHLACRPYEVWTEQDPATLSGLSAYTKKDDDGPTIRLTIGGTIFVDDELYALTARHPIVAFSSPGTYGNGSTDSLVDLPSIWDTDDSEPTSPFVSFDSAESSDESDDDSELSSSSLEIQAMSKKDDHRSAMWEDGAAQTSPGRDQPEAPTLELPAHREIQSAKKIGSIVMDLPDCSNARQNRLDWALIRLDEGLDEMSSNSFQVPGDQKVQYITEASSMQNDCTRTVSEVWINAGVSGMVRGQITQGLTSLHWNGAIFDAERIALDHPLIPGDSGSWVIQNGRLRGHIVAQRPTMLFAYMIPIEAIFEDIKFWKNAKHVRIATYTSPQLRCSTAWHRLTAEERAAVQGRLWEEDDPTSTQKVEVKHTLHQDLNVDDVPKHRTIENNASGSNPVEPKCGRGSAPPSFDGNTSGADIDNDVIFSRESLDFLLPAAELPNSFKAYEKTPQRKPWRAHSRVGKMSERQDIVFPEVRQRMDDDLTHLERYPGPQSAKADWKPFVMSWPFLLFLIVMANVYTFAFSWLLVFGFRTSTNPDAIEIIPSSLLTNVALLSSPLLMSVVYGSLWKMTDAEVARLEPFYQLSSSRKGVRGADSLTLDYVSRNIFYRLYLSLRRGHWTVFISSSITLLTSIIAPVLSAAEISIPPSSPDRDEPGNGTFFVIQKTCGISLCIIYSLTSTLAVALLVKITKAPSGLHADPRGIAGVALVATRFQGLRHFQDCDFATQEDIQRTIGHRLFCLVDSSLYENDPHDCGLYPLHGKLSKTMVFHSEEGCHPTILQPKAIFALISGVLLSSALLGILTMLPLGRIVAYSAPWFQTLLLVLFNLCWERLDVAIRLLQPYYLLHQRHAPPRTLLIDYTARPALYAAFQALRQRHFVVGLVALCRILGGHLIVLAYFTSCWANMSSAVADRESLAEAWLAIKDSVDGVVAVLLSTVFVIAGCFIFVAILVFSRRLTPFLPRQPTTIASVLAFIHQSQMMYYFNDTEMSSCKALGRSLDELGGTYGFGWFEGRDGRNHLGIDKEEIIAGYKHGFDYSRATIPWVQDFEEWF